MLGFDDVAGVHEDDAGAMGLDFLGSESGVGEDDGEVAGGDELGGGTVDLKFAFVAVDHISGEAGTVVDVEDIDLLEFTQASGATEFTIDGDRAFIVGVGSGDGEAVKLGSEELRKHDGGLIWMKNEWSQC